MADIVGLYYEKLMQLMLSPSGTITVAGNYQGQMKQIEQILDNDATGLISTILNFQVGAATVPLSFDSNNAGFNKLLSDWSKNLNSNVSIDIPKGLRSFTEQYFRERWKSSFIVLRIKWDKVNGYEVPTRMWLMDGSSIYVKNDKGNLNSNEYYFGKPDSQKSNLIDSTTTETIIIRKPYNSWYDAYPVPYLKRNGALYQALFKLKLIERQAEFINTAFPYQFLIKMGCEEAMRRGLNPTEAQMKEMQDKFKNLKGKMDEHAFAKGFAGAFPFDVNFQELIPDYLKALDDKIHTTSDKKILSALGMIELQGFSSNRTEMILNPKVLVEEIQESVLDYVELIQEVVDLIKERNKGKYTVNDTVTVSAGTIKAFLTDEMKTLMRSWYDRGLISMEDALEDTTPLKFETQVKKRKQEIKDKIDVTMFPRIVQNVEAVPDSGDPQDDVPDDKKKGTPESKNFKNASEEFECITEPMKMIDEIPEEILQALSYEQAVIFRLAFNEEFSRQTELKADNFFREKASMEYAAKQITVYLEAPYSDVKQLPVSIKDNMTVELQKIFMRVVNQALKSGKSEASSMKIGWSIIRKVGQKDPKTGIWIKKS